MPQDVSDLSVQKTANLHERAVTEKLVLSFTLRPSPHCGFAQKVVQEISYVFVRFRRGWTNGFKIIQAFFLGDR